MDGRILQANRARLGHDDIAMTRNRYSHVTPDMQRMAADTLDVAFRDAV